MLLEKPVRYAVALKDTLTRPDSVKARPIHIQLEPTSYCNLACIMCPHHIVVKKPRHMTLENFQHVIDLIKPLKLTLSGLGEPLMNPAFFDMVAYASAQGADVNTTTNATLITPERAEKLASCGLGLVSISVDAATRETYHTIRQQDWFDRVLEGIRNFRDARAKRQAEGQPAPNLRLCFVISQENLTEMPAFIRLAQEMHCDMVYFQVLRVYAELENDREKLVARFSKDDYRRILLETQALADSLGVPHNLEGILKKLDVFWRAYDREQDTALCPLPWFSTYIDVDGYPRPCCQFCADSSQRMGESLFNVPLGESWNSAAYQQFRHEMGERERTKQVCQECIPETLGDIMHRSIEGYSPGFL